MDKRLRNVALVLRALTDIIFLLHLICDICEAIKFQMDIKLRSATLLNVVQAMTPSTYKYRTKTGGSRSSIRSVADKIAHKLSWFSLPIIIGFLALLPIPQLLIVFTFYKVRDGSGLERIKVLNVFLLAQYLPKIYQIHLLCKERQKSIGIWVKGLFNFFLYILSGHVLGAFWYFFSIQRETSCWHWACVNYSSDPTRCMSTFYCDNVGIGAITSRNATFLNEHCPIDTSDSASAPFNFGIFLDSLQNHNTEHKSFEKKFFYSFWWGLRNISNFGTNLTTSTFVWENLFAILISITSFLLVSFLIEIGKTFMEMEAAKSEEMRRKIQMRKLDVYRWIYREELPEDLKKEIMDSIKEKLKESKYDDLQNSLYSILPRKTRISLKRCLCMKILQTVPMLEKMNIPVLEMMCDYMRPVMYDENSFPFRIGDPLDRMLFVIEGTMWIYPYDDCQSQSQSQTTCLSILMAPKALGKGQFYGEELLNWASAATSTKFPVSTQHVKSQTKVEAFALMAMDLATVVSKCQLQWDMNKCNNAVEVQRVAASAITTALRRRLDTRVALARARIEERRDARH